MDVYQLLPPTITLQNDVIKNDADKKDEKGGEKRRGSASGNNNEKNKMKVTVDLEEIRTHNLKIKKLAFKHVRRPGRSEFQNLLECC